MFNKQKAAEVESQAASQINSILNNIDTTHINQPQQAINKEVISKLAKLSSLEYEQIRGSTAKQLKIRTSTLDKIIKKEIEKNNDDNEKIFPIIVSHKNKINPSELLSEISQTIHKFIVCLPEIADATTLWIAMTWFIDVIEIAPLLVITAPEKRCGKSILLFLLKRLVYRPLIASNITPSALFRSIDAWQPTLLIDETDTFIRGNEELRGIINCGHTRESAYIVKVTGEDHTPKRFNAWGAKALAGIGSLAGTLMDRAIIVKLRRKLANESVERLRYAEPSLFSEIASRLSRFSFDYSPKVRSTRPLLPYELNDRAQDNWEPLLAIAEVAGGDWPQRARNAALKLSGNDKQSLSLGVELLADIYEIFKDISTDRIFSEELIRILCHNNEKRWATLNNGKPITNRQLSGQLKKYGISSRTIRIKTETAKGYMRTSFDDAFARYLPSFTESVTPSQVLNLKDLSVTDDQKITTSITEKVTVQANIIACCDSVTDVASVL